ncbi:MAG: hypothetical protein LBB81_08510 [Treponema sp.]|jgi:hypothetical protein|nr:hypothetical protein [Treponema sp.]
MAMFENTSALTEQMKIELAKQEYQLADGSTVSNLEGICQALIGRALDGDLQVVSLISDLLSGKK